MPNISELFISLGIKGSEKTLNVLSNVKVGLGNIIDTSLAAKAAILAAVYALEQLTTGAAQDGLELQNLSTYIEVGTKSLQQWRNAALQAGISNKEFDQSAKSIHDRIKDFEGFNHVLPDGSYVFAEETHFDFGKKFKVDDILPKLLEFARNKKYSRSQIEKILEQWGLTPNEISQAILGKFSGANLKNGDILSGKEINKLSNVSIEWGLLENKVKMFIRHLTAKDGEEAVKNLSKMADALFRIANDLERISTKLGVFKLIGTMFHGWDMILGTAADALEGKRDKKNQLENLLLPSDEENRQLFNDIRKSYQLESGFQKIISMNPIQDFFTQTGKNLLSGFHEFKSDASNFSLFNNNPTPSRFNLQDNPNNININQHLTFQNPGTDATKVMDIHSKSVGHAVAQATRNINHSRVT